MRYWHCSGLVPKQQSPEMLCILWNVMYTNGFSWLQTCKPCFRTITNVSDSWAFCEAADFCLVHLSTGMANNFSWKNHQNSAHCRSSFSPLQLFLCKWSAIMHKLIFYPNSSKWWRMPSSQHAAAPTYFALWWATVFKYIYYLQHPFYCRSSGCTHFNTGHTKIAYKYWNLIQ
jgi:hypothetical protein